MHNFLIVVGHITELVLTNGYLNEMLVSYGN